LKLIGFPGCLQHFLNHKAIRKTRSIMRPLLLVFKRLDYPVGKKGKTNSENTMNSE
jgi:hypothetical protein